MAALKEFAELTYSAGQKINAEAIEMLFDRKYPKYEIMDYLRNYLAYDKHDIYHGEADYIVKMTDRGHVQIVNDPVYGGTYLHQLVVARALDLTIDKLKDRQYIIHHINTIKDCNELNNLYIFYDKASHIAFHQLLKKDSNADIKEFNNNYITSLLKNADDEEKIRINQYLTDVDKLQEVQEMYEDK